MKKGKILVLGIIGVLLLMLVGCSDSLTPTASNLLKGTATPGSTLTVYDASGQQVASGQTNASGQYAISGVPAGPDVQVHASDGSKVNVYYNTGSGDIYADGMTSANTNLVDLLNELKASGNAIDSVDLLKLQEWLAFAGVTGQAFKDTIKEIWNAEGKQLFDEYKVVSGWTTQYWDNKQKEEFQKYVHDKMAENYAAGAGNLSDVQKTNALYATGTELFNDLASSSTGGVQVLAKVGFALLKADWFTGQNIADAAKNAGLFSVKTQSAVFNMNNFKYALKQYQDYMLYSVIYAAATGYALTISDTTTKAIFITALTLLNNYVTALLVSSPNPGTEIVYKSNTDSAESARLSLKQTADTYISKDVSADATTARTLLSTRTTTGAETLTNVKSAETLIDSVSSDEERAKILTYIGREDIPVVEETP